MSNQNYAYANAAFLKGEINWLSDNIKVALLNPSYTGGNIAISGDIYFTAIAPYILVGSTPIKTLTGKSVNVGSSYGITNAAAVTFSSLSASQILGYLCIFKDPDINNTDGAPSSGNQGISQLIHLIDSGYMIGTGTDGGDIEVIWNTSGIFNL